MVRGVKKLGAKTEQIQITKQDNAHIRTLFVVVRTATINKHPGRLREKNCAKDILMTCVKS